MPSTPALSTRGASADTSAVPTSSCCCCSVERGFRRCATTSPAPKTTPEKSTSRGVMVTPLDSVTPLETRAESAASTDDLDLTAIRTSTST